jgi:hypothetical protein
MKTRSIIVDRAGVIPGVLPDGTPMGKFIIESTNLGDIEWMMSPRQAAFLAESLGEYAALYLTPKRRRRA